MTNKEKYKQAFSVLHTSDISEGEVKYMAKLKKQQKQQQSGNDTTDTSINNIEKQIKKLLN